MGVDTFKPSMENSESQIMLAMDLDPEVGTHVFRSAIEEEQRMLKASGVVDKKKLKSRNVTLQDIFEEEDEKEKKDLTETQFDKSMRKCKRIKVGEISKGLGMADKFEKLQEGLKSKMKELRSNVREDREKAIRQVAGNIFEIFEVLPTGLPQTVEAFKNIAEAKEKQQEAIDNILVDSGVQYYDITDGVAPKERPMEAKRVVMHRDALGPDKLKIARNAVQNLLLDQVGVGKAVALAELFYTAGVAVVDGFNRNKKEETGGKEEILTPEDKVAMGLITKEELAQDEKLLDLWKEKVTQDVMEREDTIGSVYLDEVHGKEIQIKNLVGVLFNEKQRIITAEDVVARLEKVQRKLLLDDTSFTERKELDDIKAQKREMRKYVTLINPKKANADLSFLFDFVKEPGQKERRDKFETFFAAEFFDPDLDNPDNPEHGKYNLTHVGFFKFLKSPHGNQLIKSFLSLFPEEKLSPYSDEMLTGHRYATEYYNNYIVPKADQESGFNPDIHSAQMFAEYLEQPGFRSLKVKPFMQYVAKRQAA